MALRLDQPLLRIGNKVTNWVPAVGAVAGATVVGAAAVVAGASVAAKIVKRGLTWWVDKTF